MVNESTPTPVIAKPVSLRDHPQIDEAWVHQHLIGRPGLLGLGELTVRDHERPQPTGGRLDLLLEDAPNEVRYTVEVQLGRLDESHLVRAIEYWDTESRRFPQYHHVAVVVAEDVTSRFLNVVSLFNRTLPLMAIQLKGYKVEEHFTLIATRVVDLMPLGTEDDNEREAVNRAYWEQNLPSRSLSIVDRMLELTRDVRQNAELRYRKSYVSVTLGGPVRNFLIFTPQKSAVVAALKLPQEETLTQAIDEAGLDQQPYDTRWGFYRVRVCDADLNERREKLKELFAKAIEAHLAE